MRVVYSLQSVTRVYPNYRIYNGGSKGEDGKQLMMFLHKASYQAGYSKNKV